jgi:hypothetical protein
MTRRRADTTRHATFATADPYQRALALGWLGSTRGHDPEDDPPPEWFGERGHATRDEERERNAQ